MAEILSLSKTRKAKARAEHRQQAEENRVRFGRTREERAAAAGDAALDRRRLDGHRLDPDRDGPPDSKA
jgi:hypothetical protein